MIAFPERGLYAITDGAFLPPQRLLEAVEAALRGGTVAVQYRDKGSDPERRRRETLELKALCGGHQAPLLINDDVDLARSVRADGVHLGQADAPLAAARETLGPQAIIGISCNNVLERAVRAQQDGASYVAFGRFFPSRTKPDAVPASPALLRAARDRLRLPIVAIGGITPENGLLLLEAGADLLAAIHGLFGAEDPEAAARRYAELFA